MGVKLDTDEVTFNDLKKVAKAFLEDNDNVKEIKELNDGHIYSSGAISNDKHQLAIDFKGEVNED